MSAVHPGSPQAHAASPGSEGWSRSRVGAVARRYGCAGSVAAGRTILPSFGSPGALNRRSSANRPVSAASAASTWSAERSAPASTDCASRIVRRHACGLMLFGGRNPDSTTAVACGNTSIADPFTDPLRYRGNASSIERNAWNPIVIHS